MDYYAKVIIVDTNIEQYESSISIWAEYGIKSHRVDSIERMLEELYVYKYHLIVIVTYSAQWEQVLNSIQLLRELTQAPIVIASNDPLGSEHKIAGFDMGADEVWEMPACIDVAVAKGNAIIRRYLQLNKEIDRQSTIIVNKHIVLSTAQRLVFIKGNKVELPRIEFDILTLLITYPRKVFTYEFIFSKAWGNEFTDISKEILRNHIYKLREKLRIDPTLPNYIKKHHGVGYSFTPEYNK